MWRKTIKITIVTKPKVSPRICFQTRQWRILLKSYLSLIYINCPPKTCNPPKKKQREGAPGRKTVRHSLVVFWGSRGVVGWSPPSASSLLPSSGSGRLSVGVSASDDRQKRQIAKNVTVNPSLRAFEFPRHSALFFLCCADHACVK